ncbi:MAG: MFS transporter [Verrucomicrobiota bacterium]
MDSPSQAHMGFRNYRWIICALLFFGWTVNYMDRQIVALCKDMLDKELGWTNEQYGMVTSIFQISYGPGLLAFGWFVDRFGAKIGYAVSLIGWSIAAAAYWFVHGVTGFLATRFWVGLGESGNFPSAIKAVTLWFPKRERALAISIFNSGPNVAGMIAPALIPPIAFYFGWRGAYLAAALAALVCLALWLVLYQVPEKLKRLNPAEMEHILSDRDEIQPQKMPWASLIGYRQTWSFIVGKVLTDPVWWFYLAWLPDFFKKTRGLDIKHSWPHIVTIYTMITVLSIYGGWVTGHLIKRGWTVTRARKTGMFIFALCVVPIVVVTRVGDWTAVALIGFAAAAHQAWSANLSTTVSDMFPKKAVASVIGIGGIAGACSSFFFPIFCGWVLDHFSKTQNETAGYAILFAICASAYLVAFGLIHLCAPRFEQVKIKGAD